MIKKIYSEILKGVHETGLEVGDNGVTGASSHNPFEGPGRKRKRKGERGGDRKGKRRSYVSRFNLKVIFLAQRSEALFNCSLAS